jgi:hypothetical protein
MPFRETYPLPRVRQPAAAPPPAFTLEKRVPEVPQTFGEGLRMSNREAKLAFQQLGQGAANLIMGKKNIPDGAERLAKIQKERDDLAALRKQYVGDGNPITRVAKEALVNYPSNWANWAIDIAGPKKLEALYHTGRKFVETGSPRQAIVAGASNLVGEKIEDLAGRLPFLPKNVAGNVVGGWLENQTNAFLNGIQTAPVSAPVQPKPAPANPAAPYWQTTIAATQPTAQPYGPNTSSVASAKPPALVIR